jgi:hypothetical protein
MGKLLSLSPQIQSLTADHKSTSERRLGRGGRTESWSLPSSSSASAASSAWIARPQRKHVVGHADLSKEGGGGEDRTRLESRNIVEGKFAARKHTFFVRVEHAYKLINRCS